MSPRLEKLLESLLRNIDTLNEEALRLSRTDQFTPGEPCARLIEQIRESCLDGLKTVQRIERTMNQREAAAP